MEKTVETGALALEARIKETAKVQFAKLMKAKARWLANNCWPSHLEFKLKQINEIIEAGRKMGVTTASLLDEKEIKEYAEKFAPLRTLEMVSDIYALLVFALEAKGVHHEVFAE